MASGNLTRTSLTAATYTNIAAGPASGYTQIINVSICNTNASAVQIRLALCATGTSTPAASDFIEYDAYIAGYGVLEKTGIALGNGHIILAYANSANVNFVVNGLEGLGTASSGIMGRIDMPAATWQTLVSAPSAGRMKAVTVNITNRNITSTQVRLCIASNPVSPAAGDYIEYNYLLAASSVLERTGILIDSGKGVGVYTSTTGVSAVAHGIEDSA